MKKLKFEKRLLKIEINIRRLQKFNKKNTNYVILNLKRENFSKRFLQTRRKFFSQN